MTEKKKRYLVRESQALVELLGGFDHVLLDLVRFLQIALDERELFDFFELMHTEDTPGVLTMRTYRQTNIIISVRTSLYQL